jgi:hypothetical protein
MRRISSFRFLGFVEGEVFSFPDLVSPGVTLFLEEEFAKGSVLCGLASSL